jgi:crotonobetainyl-CoA:carnitine CoA-transferase CaiB-like acyl-CoA transferase
MYNRGKRSVAIDLREPRGRELAHRLLATADVFVENFRPGATERLGLGPAALAEAYPRLIYCSEKGFLAGPYAHRTALDEVVQMMAGLAYMTGPPGRPLRAGASVVDVSGGLFGVIGILAALDERHRTGRGRHVSSALFETTAYLVGQHMAQHAVTGRPAAPMPARVSAWAVYDVFDTAGGDQLFVAVVSDAQWQAFCAEFGLDDLAADPALRTNAQRVEARPVLLPRLRALIGAAHRDQLVGRLERAGLPFAPIGRPEDLFDDPHLRAGGGLRPVRLPDGRQTSLPGLPLAFDDVRPTGDEGLPAPGADTAAVLATLGLDPATIDALARDGVVHCAPPVPAPES